MFFNWGYRANRILCLCLFRQYFMLAYAILTGLAFALADVINLRVHAFGAIEFITRIPMLINAGLLWDLVNFVIACCSILWN